MSSTKTTADETPDTAPEDNGNSGMTGGAGVTKGRGTGAPEGRSGIGEGAGGQGKGGQGGTGLTEQDTGRR